MHPEASPLSQKSSESLDAAVSSHSQHSHCSLRSHAPRELAPSPPPSLPHSLHPLPISALAAILGCTRSTIRHFADRLGFRFTARRIGPRHKPAACLTPDQVAAITAEVERDSATVSRALPPSIPPSPKDEGLFYLVQLEPDHDPGRYKLGFSSDVEARLDDLLTVVPYAKLIATWPCHRSWERIAIIATSQNSEQLSQEVFRAERLEDAIANAERFFAVMPKLGSQTTPPISQPITTTWAAPSTQPILPISPIIPSPPRETHSPPLRALPRAPILPSIPSSPSPSAAASESPP